MHFIHSLTASIYWMLKVHWFYCTFIVFPFYIFSVQQGEKFKLIKESSSSNRYFNLENVRNQVQIERGINLKQWARAPYYANAWKKQTSCWGHVIQKQETNVFSSKNMQSIFVTFPTLSGVVWLACAPTYERFYLFSVLHIAHWAILKNMMWKAIFISLECLTFLNHLWFLTYALSFYQSKYI